MERTGRVVQQGRGSASIDVSEERSAVEGMPEARRFYPDAQRCTGLTWQFLVKELMGAKPAIPEKRGNVVLNFSLSSGQRKVQRPRVGNFDVLIQKILKDAGSLATPEIHEEILLLGGYLSIESLLKVCKKLEERGILTHTKRQRAAGGGKGINVWRLKESI